MAEEQEERVENDWLDRVLDAQTNAERYDIVCRIRDDISDRLIDNIATVLDLSIPDGDLAERYRQLQVCLRTKEKYEVERGRR